MELSEIRMGDTVRLRNGETITVAHKMESYTDRDGEHPGPFVSARGSHFDKYALSDITEVVESNPRLCRFCGEGVTATDDKVDYCSGCFYSGRALTETHADLLASLSAIPNVTGAHVWHTGGGCFLVACYLEDGRLVTLTDADAALPYPGEPWRLMVVSESEQAYDEWDESKLDIREGEWDDAQIVAAVSEVSR